MKKITKEHTKVEEYVMYQATDGTEFNSEVECAEYEASARGVLRGRLKEFIVNDRYNCWDLLGGDEENQCLAIVVPSEEAKYVILQNYYLDQAWILNPDNSKHKERVDNAVQKAYENNDIILFGFNCDDGLYLIDTRMSIIDRLTNLDKKDDSEG
jgi:hypothetical protein